MDEDGKNEILVGSDNIYLLNSNGEMVCTYFIDNYTYRGVSEIISHQNEIVFSFWHYKETKRAVRDDFRVANAFFTITKISYSNRNFTTLWSRQIEDQDDLTSTENYRMFAETSFYRAYLTQISPSGIRCINLTNGGFIWKHMDNSVEAIDIGIAVLDNFVVINGANDIWILDKGGEVISHFFIYEGVSYNIVRNTLTCFDIDGDDKDEVLLIDREGMFCFSISGEKEWYVKLWQRTEGYLYSSPPILHADTDNDGFDEIITTDPEGRIVIIDNGTPPQAQESGIPTEIMAIGAIGAIITASAVIWIWRKRR